MHLSDQGLIVILVVRFIAGRLAGKVVWGTGFGLVGDATIGIVAALIPRPAFAGAVSDRPVRCFVACPHWG